MKIPKNPFKLEYMRSKLALEHKFEELLKTYSCYDAELKNVNSPEMWDRQNSEFIDNPMSSDRIRKVLKEVKLDNNSSYILNIGVGSANLEREFFKNQNKKPSLYGIDISKKSIITARKKYPFANFLVSNIVKTRLQSNYFDYVIVLEVMEHISPHNTFKALNEIVRVVKPGGTVIVSVPLNEGLEEMVRRGKNPNAHVRVYTPALIKAELTIAGLKVIKENLLYAFHDFYQLKTFFVSNILRNFRSPNNIIVFAQKPI